MRTGDRVLVLTSYGELPARVVGFDQGRIMLLCPPFYYGQFLAWATDVREPMDAAADERMRMPQRLATSAPVIIPEPIEWPRASWFKSSRGEKR